uniref:Ig-like domain-containing protein n=1 Tax=Oreochromis niloticus TaxID=8128 RepID=I3JMV4_ORENI
IYYLHTFTYFSCFLSYLPEVLNVDDVSLSVVADTEVSCIFMESCMLPCSYGGSDVVIHWIQVSTGDINVHSFYHNKDQLERQNQRFRGRTSLFNDRISTGNASLQLTKVEVQDEGKYKCYTSTIDGNKDKLNFFDVYLLVVSDTEVSCVYMENCTLPCSYEGADVVIHWHQVSAGNLPVHSFFHNQDQPENSAQRFRGRASTFKDQISRGNASVLLTGVKVQDEGRYKCYTSTINGNKESFINLKIDVVIHICLFYLYAKYLSAICIHLCQEALCEFCFW